MAVPEDINLSSIGIPECSHWELHPFSLDDQQTDCLFTGGHYRPEEGAGGGEEGLPKQLREDMRSNFVFNALVLNYNILGSLDPF